METNVTQPVQNTPEQTVLKKIPSLTNPKNTIFIVLLAILIVLVGIASGWFMSGANSNKTIKSLESNNAVNEKKEVGSSDESTFKDSAEGLLEEGGVSGEGTHHLTRPGGMSQNVYLTSTVIDLGSFVGKKVQVWGQTVSARRAGWLMDVGKVKLIE